MKRRLIRHMAVLAVLIMAVLVPTAQSSAATAATGGTDTARVAPTVSCSGFSCDGQWPDISGCANTAITAEQYAFYAGAVLAGYIQLRYSTACRTTWGRIISYNSGPGENASVYRNYDDAHYTCDTYAYSSSLGAYSCYTQMLQDGGFTSYAWGAVSYGGSAYLYGQTASY